MKILIKLSLGSLLTLGFIQIVWDGKSVVN